MISEKEIIQSIVELLGQNKFLTIPGFGTLEVEIIPSYTYKKEILFPPTRRLSTFDGKKIGNDKVLTEYLMRKFQLDPTSINRKLQLITSNWKSQLKNGVLVLDKIGKFERGKNNRILFSPVTGTLETATLFGLPEKISKADLSEGKSSEVLESFKNKDFNESIQRSDDPSRKATTTKDSIVDKPKDSRRGATNLVTPSKKLKKSTESSQSKIVKDTKRANQNAPKHRSHEPSTSRRKLTVRQENTGTSDSSTKKKIKPGVSYYPRRKPSKTQPVVVYLLLLCIIIALVAPYIAVSLLGYQISIERKSVDTKEIVTMTPLVESTFSEDVHTETIESSPGEDSESFSENSENQIKAEASIYYVAIAASFESEDKANEYVDELRNDGFPARLSTNRSFGRYRVIYNGFDSLEGALVGLREIRNTVDKDAWLLREK